MWSKEEARKKRIRFFTNFGVYMKKHAEFTEQKIRWVNYRTGVSAIRFKIEADNKTTRVVVDIVNSDIGLMELFYEQFTEFKTMLEANMDELIWEKNYYNATGQRSMRIYTETSLYSMNNEEHWGDLFRFYEKNMLALHEFWDNSKDIFIDLEN
jgi:hypothetical protein|tara:strand:- start:1057 stop:1518 length:462 start_codon:yes stop_codon:yes gene_type:complete